MCLQLASAGGLVFIAVAVIAPKSHAYVEVVAAAVCVVALMLTFLYIELARRSQEKFFKSKIDLLHMPPLRIDKFDRWVAKRQLPG